MKQSRYEIDPITGKVIERVKIHAKFGKDNTFDINKMEEENIIEDL